MKDQLDIFEEAARARRFDPATSHMAAERVKEFAPATWGRILGALERYGPCTVSQIATATGLAEQQVNKRLPEMARRGQVSVASNLLRPGASGRMQRVWRAV